ncbi:hypothetical protein A5740_17660 [Mycobacterium sp. GA-1841]|uniref:DUF5134 domain-containing protein n=1 Tax=Mycobacterium sp. GA-1841 TaxID=1834154 RepID=UPI00096ECF9C|nr:DUF5134 domain-containing protein [Mycobacterium sp. GA-1841]OMC29578.1 hypothetical protein A5740_17660 [Mycobacterium sp. GA-1841]
MIADLALRWVVTVLFALSAAECVYAFTRSHERPSIAVSQLLHLAMAVAMVVMAWPRGAELPTVGPMFFFLAAAVWFLTGVMRIATSGDRLVNGYHAVMMSAMVWMYAVMNGNVLVAHGDPVMTGHDGHSMHMAAHTVEAVSATMEHGVAQPMWINAVNWTLTVGFVIAVAVWLYRYFAGRQSSEMPSSGHFGMLCRAMMAAGMAVMFGVMV